MDNDNIPCGQLLVKLGQLLLGIVLGALAGALVGSLVGWIALAIYFAAFLASPEQRLDPNIMARSWGIAMLWGGWLGILIGVPVGAIIGFGVAGSKLRKRAA